LGVGRGLLSQLNEHFSRLSAIQVDPASQRGSRFLQRGATRQEIGARRIPLLLFDLGLQRRDADIEPLSFTCLLVD